MAKAHAAAILNRPAVSLQLMVLAVLFLVDGVAGQVHPQTVQGAAVHAGKQHRKPFQPPDFVSLLQSERAVYYGDEVLIWRTW